MIEIPASALTKFNGQPAVWIVDPANGPSRYETSTCCGLIRQRVAVSRGLDTGEIVVTAGVQALHPGQKVRLLGLEP